MTISIYIDNPQLHKNIVEPPRPAAEKGSGLALCLPLPTAPMGETIDVSYE